MFLRIRRIVNWQRDDPRRKLCRYAHRKITIPREKHVRSQEPANLADMVRDRAKTRGDAIVYEFEGRQTSFAEFDIRTNRVANALKALGVKPGERIAYLGKNSDVYFELLLGAMKANVVMAPVNWRLAGPEIAFIVEDCKAPVLFVGPEFVDPGPQHQAAIARRSHAHRDRRRRTGMA